MKKIKQMGLLLIWAALAACGDKPAEPAAPPAVSNKKAFIINGKRRVALVIGNADYKNLTVLPNDVNDAQDMAAVLEQFGFEVTSLLNATKEQFAHGLQAFSEKLDKDTVGLIYYSGHGAEIDNRQYLVPVDATTDKAMFKKENFDVQSDILPEVQNKAGFMMLILDACRNNPFAKAWNLPKGQVPNGFNKIGEVHGVLIASATASGDVSEGAGERNSVYTAQLLNHLRANSGEEVSLLLKDVGTSVRDVTNQDQSPWISPEYDGRFYFAQAVQPPEPPKPVAQVPPAPATVAVPAPAPAVETRQAFEPEMVKINGGCFQMGSPASEPEHESDERQHEVCVKNFEMGKTEVTQAQWQAVMGNNPSYFKGELLPVEQVSWNDVQQFISKLNQMTGKAYRLPTEAEWEYAARAGTTTPFYTGNCITTAQANYDGNYDYANCGAKTGAYKSTTVTVGSYPANALGLYDMAGNVSEWTCSAYVNNYDGSESQCSNQANTRRVLRGGSWFNGPQGLRSANRFYNAPDSRYNDLGFRLSRM